MLGNDDHLHHEQVKEGLALLNVDNGAHDSAETCANLNDIAERADTADAFNEGLAFSAVRVRYKVILLILCIGISLDSFSHQIGIVMRGQMK